MIRFLANLWGPGKRPKDDDDFWYEPVAALPAAGKPVTDRTAVLVPAVYDCLQVIARPIATLPLKVFRRLPDGGKEEQPNHPLAEILQHAPNTEFTACEFRGQLQWDRGLHNNAYAEILPGPRGMIDQLVRLDPNVTRGARLVNGGIGYETRRANGTIERIEPERVFHLRGLPLSDDGVNGRPQLETAKETISAALALLDYASRFFLNDTTTGGIIEYPSHFADDESRWNFLRAWRRQGTGNRRHSDKVLERGAKYNKTGMTNEQAQFIETRKELWVELAQFWQVPPHKIGVLDKATFSNIEQQAIEFVVDTMLPEVIMWEQKIGQKLIFEPNIFVEFNLLGLLRGDTKTRYDAYAVGRQWGWLSADDVRALENMNPLPEGQGREYLRATNMAPIGQAQFTGDPGQDRAAAASLFLHLLAQQDVKDALTRAAAAAPQTNGSLNGHG